MKQRAVRKCGAVVSVLKAVAIATLAAAGAVVAAGLEAAPASAAPIDHPDRNGEAQRLGAQLFSDPRLSADGTISCATCHPPDRHFMDGLAAGQGIGGQRSFRNTPSLLNVGFKKALFWDGRAASLEQQILGPLTNPREHGLLDAAEVVEKVREQPEYVRAFAKAYGTSRETLGMAQITDAIATYERSLVSVRSPFDRFEHDGQADALSTSARRGLELFRGRAGCAGCHAMDADPALFTDQAYHRSPQALPDSVTRNLADLARHVVAAKEQGGNALDRMIAENADVAELGRFLVTLNPSDIGSFRTPSLRNVALTAPYMHDGHYATLPEVIDAELYARGEGGRRPIALTIDERADLLAFLQSLSSD